MCGGRLARCFAEVIPDNFSRSRMTFTGFNRKKAAISRMLAGADASHACAVAHKSPCPQCPATWGTGRVQAALPSYPRHAVSDGMRWGVGVGKTFDCKHRNFPF